ncbi:Lipid phosphate phosphohydrolase 2 [Oryzias melastigma]|uniref:Lipid phosphate phosphohydrolase 2 n=1 Tax=Oryzias melastigma TaxID=30732 RepID=A0A834CEQ0_ORYME|nr:Lipid phosphate phosphohydrolase 2 [Oryzias melastigma]
MDTRRRKNLYVLMDLLCVAVVALPSIILNILKKPHMREIFCNDESIKYPVKPDTITRGILAGVTITCSVLIVRLQRHLNSSLCEKNVIFLKMSPQISSGEAYLVYIKRVSSNSGFNQYVAALYKVVGTFLFGAVASQSLTDIAKYTIGRPRPHFLATCAPKQCLGSMQVVNCTGELRKVTEARLSFYSGHSSFGMYCMLFLALYVQARLVAKWARLVRPTIQFFLVVFAVYVGYTRVSDYQHHWSDVLVGLLQGALVAVLNVVFVSDFFKKRPECGAKPDVELADHEHSNHYNCCSSPGPL